MPSLTKFRADSPLMLLGVVLLFVVLSRLLSTEQLLTGVDPANYLLGMKEYSIEFERPHPPGYPIYIALLRASAVVVGGEHEGMLFVQVVFSVLAVVFLFLLSRRWLGSNGAIVAVILLATNPLFWFYGATSENYAYDAMFSSGILLVVLSARGGWWFGAGVLLGLAAGMRSTSIVLMLPAIGMALFFRWRRGELGKSWMIVSVLGTAVGLALWLPVVVHVEGGLMRFFHLATGITSDSAGSFIGNIAGFVLTFAWMLNLSGVYLIVRWKGIFNGALDLVRFGKTERDLSGRMIVLLWIAVTVIFFVFVIHTKGYGLLTLPAVCVVAAWVVQLEKSTRFRYTITALMIAFNCLVFLAMPYVSAPSYTSLAPRNRTVTERIGSLAGRATSAYLPSLSRIRETDRQLSEALALVQRTVASGEDTTLVVIDPAAAMYAQARVMQVHLPLIRFAQPGLRRDRPLFFHHETDKKKLFGDSLYLVSPRLLLLTDRGLVDRYSDFWHTRLDSNKQLVLVEIRPEHGSRLRQRMEDLFIRYDLGR